MRHLTWRSVLRLLGLTVLLLPLAAHAGPMQAAQDIYLGGRLGGSFTTFEGNDARGLDSFISGAAPGVIAGLKLSDRLQLQTELNWVRKGAKGTVQGFEEALAVHLELDYLQLPLLARMSPFGAGSLRPFLLLGPAVALELDCDVRTEPSELALTLGCEDSAPQGERKRFDWSLLMGGGLAHRTGGATFLVEGRYDLGLVTIDQPPEALDVKNRGFAVTAGISFDVR